MEAISNVIVIGVDVLVFGYFVSEYFKYKRNIYQIKEAPLLDNNKTLKEYVASQKDQKIAYAAVCGSVAAMTTPIRAQNVDVFGVVQMLNTSEIGNQRSALGFWSKSTDVIHSYANAVPFYIRGDANSVIVRDALLAQILDTKTVYHKYEPAKVDWLGQIVSFFVGIRQRGVLITESVLPENSIVTGIGELRLEGGSVCLKPSSLGPMVLSAVSKPALVERLEQEQCTIFYQIVVFGAISVILLGFYGSKYFKKWKRARDDRRRKERIEAERRKMRASRSGGNSQLPEEYLCVVCKENPREVYFGPCGHICVCDDCSDRLLTDRCPICRDVIQERNAAFIS